MARHFLDSLRWGYLSSFPAFAAQTSSPAGPETRPEDVIKLDIINRVADKTGVPKMKAEQAVEALFHSMKEALTRGERIELRGLDRKSTRLNSSHSQISYAVFCLKKKTTKILISKLRRCKLS